MPEFADSGWLTALALLPVLAFLRWRGGAAEGRVKRTAGTVLRMLSVGALVVALAGPLGGDYARHTDVVFVLDVSSSIGQDSAREALAFVNQAIAAKPPGSRMGLVVFGADAAVESLLREATRPVQAISTQIRPGGTDIARAIEVAVGSFPSGEHRRVVLMSDGRENLGRARAAADVAASIGVEIHTIALSKAPVRDEVHISNLVAPTRVNVHEPFQIGMTLHSNEPAPVHLVVLKNGTLHHDVRLDLTAGANNYSFVEQATEAGLYEYEAVVNAQRDGEPENNSYLAFVQVDGEPKVLHAVGTPQQARYVSEALRAQGLTVEEVPGSAVPASMRALTEFDLVVLNNVSGFDLSLSKMQLLEDYVRNAGGGLIKLGGDRSYGAGGYYGTPVERALPVTMDVKSEVKIPSLAVVFVLDRSGSMGSRSQGQEKLAIAKSAALSAIEVLNPLDQVGVLAFDSRQEWIVPPMQVGDRAAIVRKLRQLATGGGTDLHQALVEAHKVMSAQQAKVKHMIVLSDGLNAGESDFESVSEQINADGITVSTVAMGVDSDRRTMQALATEGRGRYYYTDDIRNVPRIFTSETMVVARDLVVEAPTSPLLVHAGEILKGFQVDALPQLAGYQRVFPKPSAQVLLATAEQDPLLISWRHGLGKSVAFTSDLGGRWGREWVTWDGFGRFVAQMARWSMRRSGSQTLVPEFRWEGPRGEVLVDALDADERYINALAMQAVLTDPQRGTQSIALRQVAPGRYRGEFQLPHSGRYYMSLSGSTSGDGAVQVGPRTFGLAVPYSSEYLDLGVDRALLADVAQRTGGRMLPMRRASLPVLLEPKTDVKSRQYRIWWPFLLAALLALLLEVAVRKIALPLAWQERWARRRGVDPAAEQEPSYDALSERIAEVRAAHLKALREGGSADNRNPSVRARLYVAGRKRD